MYLTRRIAIVTLVGVSVVGLGAGAAVATGHFGDDADEQESPIEGTDLDRASAAALEHTGEGRVTDTEVGDEESRYEVEVTLDDGSRIDVQLDDSFQVVDATVDDAGDDDE